MEDLDAPVGEDDKQRAARQSANHMEATSYLLENACESLVSRIAIVVAFAERAEVRALCDAVRAAMIRGHASHADALASNPRAYERAGLGNAQAAYHATETTYVARITAYVDAHIAGAPPARIAEALDAVKEARAARRGAIDRYATAIVDYPRAAAAQDECA